MIRLSADGFKTVEFWTLALIGLTLDAQRTNNSDPQIYFPRE